jgi:hypothetical protein
MINFPPLPPAWHLRLRVFFDTIMLRLVALAVPERKTMHWPT